MTKNIHSSRLPRGTKIKDECRITAHKKIIGSQKRWGGVREKKGKRKAKREFADRVVSKTPYLNRKM